MKILFVSSASEVYGSERSLLTALGAMETFETAVICPSGGTLEAALHASEIPVYGAEFNRYSFRRRPDWHLRLFFRVLQILRRSRPQAVVISLGGNTPVVSLCCMLRRIPVVRVQRFEFRNPTRRIDGFFLRRAAAIVCVSKHVQQQVRHWMGPHGSERVHCLWEPQGLPALTPGLIEGVQHKYGLGDGPVLGYFGRLHRQKRVEVLIRAMTLVKVRFPGVRLLIVGDHDQSDSGAAYAKSLEALVEDLHCSGEVSFLGYQEDAFSIMAACDLTVLPSETESFGRVLAESWSVCVPTIAADIPACREITEASGAGVLFPLGDHDVLARHIEALLSNPTKRVELGASGRDWVSRQCDPCRYAEKLEQILLDVVQPAGSSRQTIRSEIYD